MTPAEWTEWLGQRIRARLDRLQGLDPSTAASRSQLEAVVADQLQRLLVPGTVSVKATEDEPVGRVLSLEKQPRPKGSTDPRLWTVLVETDRGPLTYHLGRNATRALRRRFGLAPGFLGPLPQRPLYTIHGARPWRLLPWEPGLVVQIEAQWPKAIEFIQVDLLVKEPGRDP